MNHYLTTALCAAAFAAFTVPARAQMTLVEKGKAKARIVIAEDNAANRRAAAMLQRFVKETSGATLPIATGTGAGRGTVVIGQTTAEAGTDGFAIDCKGGTLSIASGGGKGAIYGVADLLERNLGVAYYSYNEYTLTPQTTVKLPAIHRAETPAFRFRQSQSYCAADSTYYDWFRLSDQSEVFADNLWVHTFDRLMPSTVYGESHPEYYSYINGGRRPGNHSQWCLTSPAVFDLVAAKLDSIFRANPGKQMVSVSQNDGNNTYCQCDECRKVDEYEGSPSGNIIRFLNKLATRFPDKQFSTLAYLFSMHPPKHTRPLPNVNIMLCDIDCKREVALTDNASGQDFMRALKGWSEMSDNIFVWDYGINFDNMVAPFPNFHILQKNLELFHRHHATMVFEQVNGQRGTDFSELRAYMLAKLMWNPYQDADSLMQTFLRGYYGAAAPYLYRYRQLLEGGLLASGVPLWIYDSPISHKDGMLNDHLMKEYGQIFDDAERAVAADTVLLRRVRTARLPLMYSSLEIARTRQGGDAGERIKLLDEFKSTAARCGVTVLNERNNRIDDYCDLYRQRFIPRANDNKAANAKVTWTEAPADRYKPIADKALTDGLYGGTTYVESWVGWEGRDADFTLDMGETKSVSSVSTDFLHQLGAWILLPRSVSYAYSTDGKTFTDMGTHEFAEDRDLAVKFVPGTVALASPVQARYIRVKVKTLGLCPSWHYGVGHPAWFFLDEVTVQ